MLLDNLNKGIILKPIYIYDINNIVKEIALRK